MVAIPKFQKKKGKKKSKKRKKNRESYFLGWFCGGFRRGPAQDHGVVVGSFFGYSRATGPKR
jgi:hypothetical protein